MLKNAFRTVSVLAILAALVVTLVPAGFASADDASVTIVATYVQDDLVVLDLAGSTEIATLDPQLGQDVVSINWIEDLFHGLTDIDPVTNQIVPELATDWEVSEDGTVWTFNLRDDVMWYRYDPASESAEELRVVTASDVVYGIKRGCDPRLGSYYSGIISGVIAGCDIVNQTPDADVTDDLIFGDTTRVSAPDDTTLVIELQFAAGYFQAMSSMWTLRPVHPETIEEFGAEAFAPGNIATNGPYFVQEVTRGVRRVFVRNYDHLEALDYGGNIDLINVTLIEDAGTTFALYQDDQLDTSGVPGAEVQNVLSDPELSEEIVQVFDLAVFYFAYAHDKAPFDDVRVRRAFSAIVDRAAFIEQILQGRAVPMIHFTPPGMFGAVPINEVGVGFDPEYAQTQLEDAGFPNCEGFPNIEVVTNPAFGNMGEFWAAAAEEHLGCSPDIITVEGLEFTVRLQVTSADTPTQDRPNAWVGGWGPDYADANNWVRDVLSCESGNNFLRPCTEIDDLIEQAARESDPATREQLYREIEEAFFGPEGEYPIAPLYLRTSFIIVKPWYTASFETDGLIGGTHMDSRNVDMAAKLAAREG